MEKKTNLQELYENLIDNHKKIILFGIGWNVRLCISGINTFLKIVCDNWDTPNYLENSGKYSYTFNNIMEHIEFAIDNDDEKVKKGYFDLEGRKIKVYPADILNEIDQEKYIVLITTRLYEDEIKNQICNMKEASCIL